jgi:hypothetical protein
MRAGIVTLRNVLAVGNAPAIVITRAISFKLTSTVYPSPVKDATNIFSATTRKQIAAKWLHGARSNARNYRCLEGFILSFTRIASYYRALTIWTTMKPKRPTTFMEGIQMLMAYALYLFVVYVGYKEARATMNGIGLVIIALGPYVYFRTRTPRPSE